MSKVLKLAAPIVFMLILALLPVAGTKAEPQHRSMTKVHFILNWLPNTEFSSLWVAQQKGWFKQAGIDMSFTPWSPNVHPETDVVSTPGINFGFQSGAALGIARAQGVPDKALFADAEKSVFGLTVLASSNIHKLSDLKGRKIGYQPDELYVPETMMANIGLTSSQYSLVPVGFDTSQLTSGAVDAYLTFVTNEPIALRLSGVKTRTFKAANYGFHFYDDVLFTTDNLIKSNPRLVKTVTTIVARGAAYAHTHHVYATKVTVSKYFPAASGTTAAQNYRQQLLELTAFDYFSADPHGKFSGLMRSSYWRDGVNILYKYGLIKTKPGVNLLFTNKFNT